MNKEQFASRLSGRKLCLTTAILNPVKQSPYRHTFYSFGGYMEHAMHHLRGPIFVAVTMIFQSILLITLVHHLIFTVLSANFYSSVRFLHGAN